MDYERKNWTLNLTQDFWILKKWVMLGRLIEN